MKFSFDVRGYLTPYGKNKAEFEDVKKNLVDPFDETSTRIKLYEGYLSYNLGLKKLLDGQKFKQWVDGSFVSNKINPRDIDLVNLIDHKSVDKYEKELKQFTRQMSKEKYGVDGYIVRIYPEGHPKFVRTQSDLVYWENWFSKTRMNRRKQRFPKGFIELDF